ncbi:hypothetical protein [Parasitella parasitica]|uniref:Uncharacterized protein n=1 Tax=Parasitella parasitica TaxID=35722 RepID=A0A0B7MR09_9FUNG|nr:hypothetical protein [Parasitella parasitica]
MAQKTLIDGTLYQKKHLLFLLKTCIAFYLLDRLAKFLHSDVERLLIRIGFVLINLVRVRIPLRLEATREANTGANDNGYSDGDDGEITHSNDDDNSVNDGYFVGSNNHDIEEARDQDGNKQQDATKQDDGGQQKGELENVTEQDQDAAGGSATESNYGGDDDEAAKGLNSDTASNSDSINAKDNTGNQSEDSDDNEENLDSLRKSSSDGDNSEDRGSDGGQALLINEENISKDNDTTISQAEQEPSSHSTPSNYDEYMGQEDSVNSQGEKASENVGDQSESITGNPIDDGDVDLTGGWTPLINEDYMGEDGAAHGQQEQDEGAKEEDEKTHSKDVSNSPIDDTHITSGAQEQQTDGNDKENPTETGNGDVGSTDVPFCGGIPRFDDTETANQAEAGNTTQVDQNNTSEAGRAKQEEQDASGQTEQQEEGLFDDAKQEEQDGSLGEANVNQDTGDMGFFINADAKSDDGNDNDANPVSQGNSENTSEGGNAVMSAKSSYNESSLETTYTENERSPKIGNEGNSGKDSEQKNDTTQDTNQPKAQFKEEINISKQQSNKINDKYITTAEALKEKNQREHRGDSKEKNTADGSRYDDQAENPYTASNKRRRRKRNRNKKYQKDGNQGSNSMKNDGQTEQGSDSKKDERQTEQGTKDIKDKGEDQDTKKEDQNDTQKIADDDETKKIKDEEHYKRLQSMYYDLDTEHSKSIISDFYDFDSAKSNLSFQNKKNALSTVQFSSSSESPDNALHPFGTLRRPTAVTSTSGTYISTSGIITTAPSVSHADAGQDISSRISRFLRPASSSSSVNESLTVKLPSPDDASPTPASVKTESPIGLLPATSDKDEADSPPTRHIDYF